MQAEERREDVLIFYRPPPYCSWDCFWYIMPSCRMSQARNNVCAQFRSPSFASTVMLRLPFFLVVQCPLPPSPPPTLQPPLFPMRLFSTWRAIKTMFVHPFRSPSARQHPLSLSRPCFHYQWGTYTWLSLSLVTSSCSLLPSCDLSWDFLCPFQSFCHLGKCADSLDTQCSDLWGGSKCAHFPWVFLTWGVRFIIIICLCNSTNLFFVSPVSCPLSWKGMLG